MDKKTYEYMAERTNAYRKLEEEKSNILMIKDNIGKYGTPELKLYCWTPILTNGANKLIKEHVLKALDERLKEIEKEMEEI